MTKKSPFNNEISKNFIAIQNPDIIYMIHLK